MSTQTLTPGMQNLSTAASLIRAHTTGETDIVEHIVGTNNPGDVILGLINFSEMTATLLASNSNMTLDNIVEAIEDLAAAKIMGLTPGDQVAA